DPFGDDDLEDGVAGHLPGDRDGNGPDARDLALLPADGVAPDEGVVVDPDVDGGLRPRRPVAAAGGPGAVDQGVSPVGVVAVVPPAGPGVALHGGAAGVELGQELPTLVGRQAGRHPERTVTVGPRPDV